MRKFGEVDVVGTLVLDHLQQQLHLVNIVDKLSLEGDIFLVFLEDALDLLGRQCTSRNLAQQGSRDVFHDGGLATSLLGLGDMHIDGGDISHQGLGHIVDEGHLGAVRDVQFGCQFWRGKHRHDRHAIHMVGNRLAIDTESAPAFALRGLETFEQVEEGDRRGGVLFWLVGEGRKDY